MRSGRAWQVRRGGRQVGQVPPMLAVRLRLLLTTSATARLAGGAVQLGREERAQRLVARLARARPGLLPSLAHVGERAGRAASTTTKRRRQLCAAFTSGEATCRYTGTRQGARDASPYAGRPPPTGHSDACRGRIVEFLKGRPDSKRRVERPEELRDATLARYIEVRTGLYCKQEPCVKSHPASVMGKPLWPGAACSTRHQHRAQGRSQTDRPVHRGPAPACEDGRHMRRTIRITHGNMARKHHIQ